MQDALNEFAFARLAGNDRDVAGRRRDSCRRPYIETQAPLAYRIIRPMTLEAMLRKNRAHVARVIDWGGVEGSRREEANE